MADNRAQFFTNGLPVFIYYQEDEKAKNKSTTYEEDIPPEKFYTGVVVSVNQETSTAVVTNDLVCSRTL